MTGYLGRLISHTPYPADESRMQPAIRSQSPIADMDQRIGLAGFEGLTPSNGPAAFSEFEALALEENAITATSDTASTPLTIQRKVSSGTTATASTGASYGRPTAMNVPVMAQQYITEPAPPRVAVGVPTSRPLPATFVETPMTVQTPVPIAASISDRLTDQASTGKPSVAMHDHAFDNAETLSREFPSDQTRGKNTVATDVVGETITAGVGDTEKHGDTGLSHHRTMDQPSFSPPQPFVRQLEKIISPTAGDRPQAHPTTGTDQAAVEPRSLPAHLATPVTLEPPARSPVSRPAEASSAHVFAPVAVPETTPRVVIGRINVEVIPPPSERRVTQVEPSQPVTAASVSKIGPLRPTLRSNRLFSLRQR
jgi:hypothetical protein